MARAKKYEGSVEVINLTADDPTLLMQNVKQDSQDGIVQYGISDDQFDYLLRMYTYSTTNNAIINAVSLLLFGNGLNIKGIITDDDLRKIVKDFYLFGNATIQVVNGKQMHIPVNYVRAQEVNAAGKIENYYYSTDWKDDRIEPTMLPNWELNPKAKHSIYYLRPYTPNAFYYNLPSYQGSLFYCELEEKVAQYLLNTVDNSFSVLKIINFNNGVGDEESRRKEVLNIKNKTTGVKGDKVVVAFNENKEHAATIEDVTVDNASDQYTFVSKEAQDKIVVGHGVTSPLILGIRDFASGFGSNADELESATTLYMDMQVEPKQNFISNAIGIIAGRDDLRFLEVGETVEEETTPIGETTDALVDKEASYNGAQIASALSVMENVKTGILTPDQAITFLIQMLQFDPMVAKGMFTGEASSEITSLKSNKTELEQFIDLGADSLEGFDLFDATEVDYELENELDNILDAHFDKTTNLQKLINLISTGKASPKTKSKQDTEEFAVRYRYKGTGKGDRDFCKSMSSANKTYRKEDIINMRHKPVNPGFGEKGRNTYDIWLYKGGPRCHHFWQREIYLREDVSDKSRVKLGNKISVARARSLGTVEKNNPKVAKHPNDMKHKAFVTKATMPEDARAKTTGL